MQELAKCRVSQKTNRVPTKSNIIADELSRGDIVEALRFARSAGLPICRVEAAAR